MRHATQSSVCRLPPEQIGRQPENENEAIFEHDGLIVLTAKRYPRREFQQFHVPENHVRPPKTIPHFLPSRSDKRFTKRSILTRSSARRRVPARPEGARRHPLVAL